MITVERTVDTTAARDEVAAYLSDFATTAEWDPHTKECRRVDDGPVGVGATYDNVQKIGPGSTTLRYETVDYTAGRTVVLRSESRLLSAKDRMEFADAPDGGTRVTYTATLQLKGPARLGEPILRRVMERIADDAVDGMRNRLGRLASAA